jgi:hypothetical protein
VDTVRFQGGDLGLRLNETKCEFISNTSLSTKPIFKNFIHLPVNNDDLLGALITTGPTMDCALSIRCDDMTRAATRLKLIALILLRASFSAPKLMQTLRATPYSGHQALERFHSLLRSCVCTISNTNMTDLQSIQARLPVRNGGLEIRCVSSLASAAFLVSAVDTCGLQSSRILLNCQVMCDSAFERVLAN